MKISYLEYLEETTRKEQFALTQGAQDKIEQKTRAATERVAMGLDRFTKKMLSENKYMNHEVFFINDNLYFLLFN